MYSLHVECRGHLTIFIFETFQPVKPFESSELLNPFETLRLEPFNPF